MKHNYKATETHYSSTELERICRPRCICRLDCFDRNDKKKTCSTKAMGNKTIGGQMNRFDWHAAISKIEFNVFILFVDML